MKVFYDRDADLTALKPRKIAVIGFGSQGHAHALNLRDSGMDVRVGLRKGSASWQKAVAQGLPVLETAEAAQPGRYHHDAGAGRDGLRHLQKRDRAGIESGQVSGFRPRLQYPFQVHPAAAGRERLHDRAQRPGPSGPFRVRQGPRRSLPARGPAGSVRRIPRRSASLTAPRSAAAAPRSSRPPSRKKPKPICSASKRCFAAASRNLSAPDTRPWSRPATRRRWRTSSASMK